MQLYVEGVLRANIEVSPLGHVQVRGSLLLPKQARQVPGALELQIWHSPIGHLTQSKVEG